MTVKGIIKRLIGYKPKNVPVDKLAILRESGNLVYGDNCKFEGFSVASVGYKKGYPNVKIGNNCYLCCNIMLQDDAAQVIIGDGTYIGPGTLIFCKEKITFDNDIMVSWDCTFIDTNAHSLHSKERASDVADSMKGPLHKNWAVVKNAPVHIKSKSWIGFNSIILKGVTLEEGTIIGAGSVVSKSTEDYGIYAGNPAVLVKKTD
ncbi:acyltransferase [Pinibacter aurantiacus]|uniref:Acyltransferase n=1 Tax=Pinibacter aurantiacus TaxID=2851599 RepID=A0A9E2S8H8_9BACT|nr:acyltransferase [Pinibacter aurantiacus]MBV4357836.1 acyltransferase [Pinibacter aurantiacus]